MANAAGSGIKSSYQIETTDELIEAFAAFEGPCVAHKLENGEVFVYKTINSEGFFLFHRLHQGHDDIIFEMLTYGEYLLAVRLNGLHKRKTTSLTLITDDK